MVTAVSDSSTAQSPTTGQTTEEAALAALLVQALNLQGVAAGEISPTAPLFGFDRGSLGLDSIDALEIALAIQGQYGVELRSEDPGTRSAFASLRELTAHILTRRNTG
jgi:acyl carrier protein